MGKDSECEMKEMGFYLRQSPLKIPASPSETDTRDGWEVVLEYEDHVNGLFLIDLSHISKWDVQSTNFSQIRPLGLAIPATSGDCTLQNGILISLMTPTQAAVWHLLGGRHGIPPESAYTDVTDGYALMAFLGENVFSLMEKVTPLDLCPSANEPPFLLLGPLLHVRCQIVVLGEKGGYSAVLIACPRGYGQCVLEAFLDAGMESGLRPAGESVFRHWLQG